MDTTIKALEAVRELLEMNANSNEFYARRRDVRDMVDVALTSLSAAPQGLVELIDEACTDPGGEYYTGLRCGVEDRDITDRYEAAEYGWQEAFGYVASVLSTENIASAKSSTEPDTDIVERAVREAAEWYQGLPDEPHRKGVLILSNDGSGYILSEQAKDDLRTRLTPLFRKSHLPSCPRSLMDEPFCYEERECGPCSCEEDRKSASVALRKGEWLSEDEVNERMNWPGGMAWPEGAILVTKNRYNPNHNWEYKVRVVNEDNVIHAQYYQIIEWPVSAS